MKKLYYIFIFFACAIASKASLAQDGSSVQRALKMEIVPAIEDRMKTWVDALSGYSEAGSQMIDATSAIEDIKAKQEVLVEDAILKNPPADADGSLSAKAGEMAQWGPVDDQVEGLGGFVADISTASIVMNNNSLSSASSTAARNLETVLDPTTQFNSSNIFYPATYVDTSGGATSMESELLDALKFGQLAINSYGAANPAVDSMMGSGKGAEKKVDFLSGAARKALAFDAINQPIKMRTAVKGVGLGTFVRGRMETLNEIANKGGSSRNWFGDLLTDMPDDISKYEFMNYMLYVLPLNPTWELSLETADEKGLRRRKVELYAYINMLNWEISKMTGKVLGLSAAELARGVDASNN